jgi:hypothetical protein
MQHLFMEAEMHRSNEIDNATTSAREEFHLLRWGLPLAQPRLSRVEIYIVVVEATVQTGGLLTTYYYWAEDSYKNAFSRVDRILSRPDLWVEYWLSREFEVGRDDIVHYDKEYTVEIPEDKGERHWAIQRVVIRDHDQTLRDQSFGLFDEALAKALLVVRQLEKLDIPEAQLEETKRQIGEFYRLAVHARLVRDKQLFDQLEPICADINSKYRELITLLQHLPLLQNRPM